MRSFCFLGVKCGSFSTFIGFKPLMPLRNWSGRDVLKNMKEKSHKRSFRRSKTVVGTSEKSN